MAKSRTRKKYVKKLSPEIQTLSDATADYIKQWTRQEFAKLQQEKDTSICIPTKFGYKIGLYNLHVLKNRTCEVKNHNNDLIHTFENKVSAVLYTIYTIKKQYWNADEILSIDKEINKNYTDVLCLRRSFERFKQQKDYEHADIRQSRLEIAEKRLELARDRISKIHKTAKYYKVWE